jgi:hypothetical protein
MEKKAKLKQKRRIRTEGHAPADRWDIAKPLRR